MLAAIRPSDWELPLLLHVIGATAMVGFVLAATLLLVPAYRDGAGAPARLAYRTLLLGALPAYLVMRVSAQWVLDKEGFDADNTPDWVDIGFIVAEPSLILILAGAFLARRSATRGAPGPARAAAILTLIVLAASLVAVWAMTTKP